MSIHHEHTEKISLLVYSDYIQAYSISTPYSPFKGGGGGIIYFSGMYLLNFSPQNFTHAVI